ncbi:MAG: preprotein translocase subunit SecE [Lachnospiraceae bacterium]
MTESAKSSKKKNWFAGLKTEFKKIIWADNKTLAKQTSVVVVVTAILGVLISLIDSVVLQLVNLIIK